MPNETIKLTGEWTGYTLSPDIKENDPVVARLRAISRGQVDHPEAEKVIRDLANNKVILRIAEQHNLVPTTGRNALARVLTGDNTYGAEVNYIALGTGTAAAALANTTLGTETYRKIVSSAAHDNAIAYIDVFIASADVADATYKEAGAFISGTGSANSGYLFSRVVQDFVKSGSMFISLKVTISQ